MDDVIVATDAGAVTPESTPAAVESAPVTTPEVTPDAGADSPETQPAAAEGETVKTDGTPVAAPTHNKSLDERVAELVSKKEVEMEARLIAKLQESIQQPAKLDFIPDLDMGKVNEYIKDTLNAIEQLQLDGKYVEAIDLQDELAATRQSIRDNEARKADHVQRMEAQQVTQQQTEAINGQIAKAAELVAKESNIPPEVWKAGEEFFLRERQTKPLIDAQYREKVMLAGPVAAMLWAKDYVQANMGKKETDLINSKEAAKAALPSGKTAAGVVTDAATARIAELKLAAQSGNPSDLAAYSQAKRESRQ